jgi:gentisate 1,2-dioxygenase
MMRFDGLDFPLTNALEAGFFDGREDQPGPEA